MNEKEVTKHKVVASHGLGNQLFQFAFAHYLFKKTTSKIYFENSPIVSKLGNFKSAKYKIADISHECQHLIFKNHTPINNYSLFGRLIFKIGLSELIYQTKIKSSELNVIRETRDTSFKFEPFRYPTTPTIFNGFWQHYKYVLENEEILHTEISTFLRNSKTQAYANNKLNLNSNTEYCAVHIRRGDFKVRGRDKELGLISEESYLSIISQIKANNPKIRILTFTDDVDRLSDFKKLDMFGEIYSTEVKVLPTLSIFAQSNFMIAGNSNLSWWGAFMCQKMGGVVYLPKKYYRELETFDAFDYPGFNKYQVEFEIPS